MRRRSANRQPPKIGPCPPGNDQRFERGIAAYLVASATVQRIVAVDNQVRAVIARRGGVTHVL
jgi:hypothetical protein